MAELTGLSELAAVIAEHQATWSDPRVDREVFGVIEPAVIAARLDELCRTALGSRIAGARFYQVSIGCVAGVALEDGRRVVVKVQRGSRNPSYLAACLDVRRALHAAGFPCPLPLAGPLRLGDAWATLEELDERGEVADAHEPAVRRELARTLAWLFDLARPFATHPAFGGAWVTSLPEQQVFPRPHSPIFDFAATAAGAEWIDEFARRARAQARPPSGAVSIGHFDWRAEHARFEQGRLVTSYDWDSLHREHEPVMVGAAAPLFTGNSLRNDHPQVPSLDEVRAFVAEYEYARGKSFERAERRTLNASLVYSLAYTARCCHAQGSSMTANADFRPLLREHGERLLDEHG